MPSIYEYLQNNDGTDYGDYYLVRCPSCGKKEAYIYKEDIIRNQKNPKYPIHIRCNRLNKCGYEGIVEDLKAVASNNQQISNETSQIKLGYKVIKLLDLMILNGSKHESNYLLENNKYRAISLETFMKYNVLILKDEKNEFTNLLKRMPKEDKNFYVDKKYLSKNYENRNVFLPIYSIEGELDRILLRSSYKSLSKKEIQVKLKNKAEEIWNIKDLDDTKSKIYVTEGVYDALSIIECYKDCDSMEKIGILSLPGVGKWKKIVNAIEKTGKNFSQTEFVLAFDNDEAGEKFVKPLEEALQNMQIKYSRLDLKKFKDCNEALQANSLNKILGLSSADNKKGNNNEQSRRKFSKPNQRKNRRDFSGRKKLH